MAQSFGRCGGRDLTKDSIMVVGRNRTEFGKGVINDGTRNRNDRVETVDIAVSALVQT